MEETHSDPVWGWADLLLFLGLGIPAFLAGVLLMRAITTFTGLGGNKALMLLLPQFAGQTAMLVAFAWFVRLKYDRPFLPQLRLGTGYQEAIRSFTGGFALAVAVLIAAALLRTPQIESPMQDLIDDPAAAIWVVMFAVSLGPVLEEVLFRGVFQPVGTRTLGPAAGIVLAALPFALLHGPQYAWSWRHVLMIVLAGCGFGWWRYKSQSTGAAAVMHAGYNSVIVVLYFLGKSAF
jgi:uncharacterized protein